MARRPNRLSRVLLCGMSGALIGGLCLAAVAAAPPVVRACAIDGYASLQVDGVPAMHTTAQPVPGRDWAPFTAAQSVASGRDVVFREQAADLARSLPAALRAVPYRWSFGDGAWARGRAVIHLYAHPGLYRLGVSAFDSRGKRWLLFDAALVRVVAPGQLLQANLEYEILALMLLLDRATWPVSAAAILAVAVLLVWLSRRSVRR